MGYYHKFELKIKLHRCNWYNDMRCTGDHAWKPPQTFCQPRYGLPKHILRLCSSWRSILASCMANTNLILILESRKILTYGCCTLRTMHKCHGCIVNSRSGKGILAPLDFNGWMRMWDCAMSTGESFSLIQCVGLTCAVVSLSNGWK